MPMSADRVRGAMEELREQKREKENQEKAGPVSPTSPGGKKSKKAGGGDPSKISKAGAYAAAYAAAAATEPERKQKNPVGFLFYYFGVAILAIAVARLLKGPLPFEKRLGQALRERAEGKSEARKAKEAVANEMRAKIPLVFAAGDGDIDEVRRLIAAGHDVMERSKVGETALHTSGISGNADVVTALLAAGADPNARTNGGQYLKMTPSHWMVFGKHEAGMAALVKAGANVNLQNTQGKTPVDMAQLMGQDGIPLLKLLYSAGGKPASETGQQPPEDDPPPPPPLLTLDPESEQSPGASPPQVAEEGAKDAGVEKKQEL
mmetsp:Transcript_15977/g.39253  ORF Transcript_15977/g.39253 Transcript_15977/m.39253 type:complete len:320 (-) Transcript_15977:1125-2084(-)